MLRTQRIPTVAALLAIATLIILSGCDIRVLYPSHDDESTINDEGLLAVTRPDGSQPYNPGDTVPIEWVGDVAAATVTIDLFQYGEFREQIAGRTTNDGRLVWTIPATFDADTEVPDEYQIAVRAQAADHTPGALFIQALSESFTIAPHSSGGLSDVVVGDRAITITVMDNGQEIDGDTIDVRLNGATVVSEHVLVAPPGTEFPLVLQPGSNVVEIIALNEGSVSPNTAELQISEVVAGVAVQQWRLSTGESGVFAVTAP